MITDSAVRDALHARLRRRPSRFSVPGSLPVLFFGDLPSASVATVGLNPSPQEYLDPAGRELAGARRRFETLGSLGAPTRGALTASQADHAVATMRAYFRPGKPVYGWFRALDRVTRGLSVSYEAGEAVHLDLVQEATAPAWSALAQADRGEAACLLRADLPFLRWQAEAFPLRVLVCNGATVLEHVGRLWPARPVAAGRLARVEWRVAAATVGGRPVAVAGWNLPLARPTGLGAAGETELGHLLAAHIATILPLPSSADCG